MFHIATFINPVKQTGRLSGRPYVRNKDEIMELNVQAIEKIRAKYDTQLMAINGVNSVSLGIGKNGNPCLKISTFKPAEQVRAKLPKDVLQVEVEIYCTDEIYAQE
ncbi:hypothetical protein BuS5_02520 [Desulfosarcina sp. BuS5]|uniref:hypothetical protein n=1 Tax=Desulfosarcina sp. BuS5 TaxID=933262 RepID=UPI00048226F9|nr:hypothetical protein [Desulfosarcina sp. BuS5]WDN89552.1 hypothetical protein BuS5_02520 [Desulfosarcina sp. BuS5]